MKDLYPKLLSEQNGDLALILRKIVQLRKDDVSDFQTLANFISTLNGPLENYTSDSAAANGGIPINGYYRNGNAVQQRLT